MTIRDIRYVRAEVQIARGCKEAAKALESRVEVVAKTMPLGSSSRNEGTPSLVPCDPPPLVHVPELEVPATSSSSTHQAEHLQPMRRASTDRVMASRIPLTEHGPAP